MKRTNRIASAMLGLFLLALPARAQQSTGTAASDGGRRPFAPWTGQRAAPAADPARPGAAPRSGTLQPGHLSSQADTTLEEIFKVLGSRQKRVAVNLWFPGAAALSDVEMAQGAAIAEGIALRTGNVPVSVSLASGIVPGKFNVITGTVEQLSGMLSPAEAAAVTNGYLLLRRVPNRPDTHVLLITGKTASGVDSAILTLGIAREKLPGVATAAIRDVLLPKAPPFLRREPLHPDTSYTFQQLQETGASMLMLSKNVLRIELMLPGDFAPENEGDILLDLHFSLRTQVFQGSDKVSVKVNDQANELHAGSSSPLPDGGSRAPVDLPLHLFTPGRNVLEITFSGGLGGDLQIFSDSSLSLPSCTNTPVLPNLAITSRTVYPLVGQPDGSEIMVYLADREVETIESAWTFMAKLAQMSNTLLYAAEFSSASYTGPKHVIAIGSLKNLPADIQSTVPKTVFHEPVVLPNQTPALADIDGINLKELIMDTRSGVHDRLFEPPPALTRQTLEPSARVWNKSERGYLGCVVPKEEVHGWMIVLTAETPALLRQRTEELVTPPFWEKLSGASLFWNDLPESLEVYSDPVQQIHVARSLGGTEFEVEMPFGERYTVRSWVIAVTITFFVFIFSSLGSLGRLRSLGGYRH